VKLLDRLRALRASVLARTEAAPPSPAMAAYLDKVCARAATIDDAEVRGLGADDDEIFERTIGAALGVSIERIENGLRAIEEAEKRR
jgi:hypothetical protein